MTLYTRKKILLIHSQQPSNQYSGGGEGVDDSEQHWMRRLAEEVFDLVKDLGHDVRLGPLGYSYRDNVAWVQRPENRDAALLLSFHSNATATAGDASVGIGVYHHPSSTKGRVLAEALVPFLAPVAATGKAYRGTLGVSELADTTPPALLIEHEFHDHDDSRPGGADWIRDPKNRTAIAEAYRRFIVGTWGEKVVEPPKPSPQVDALAFRFGSYNAQLARYGGGPIDEDVEFLGDVLKPSVCALQEVSLAARKEIAEELGWLFWQVNDVALAWRKTAYDHGAIIELPLNEAHHGIVGTELVHRSTGLAFHAFSLHNLPNGALPSGWMNARKVEEKLNALAKMLKKVPATGPVIIGGDFCTKHAVDFMVKRGFKLATPAVQTMDSGKGSVDFCFTRGMEHRRGGAVYATKASDHHGVLAQPLLRGASK